MDAKQPLDETDRLLAALEQLPVDALQLVHSFVAELLQCPDDNDRRKQALGAATSRMSALHSV
jgi:hypothetical protein